MNNAVNQRNVETEALVHRRRNDPPTDTYRRDKDKFVSWLLGIAGLALVAAIGVFFKHDTDIALLKQGQIDQRDDFREMKSDVKELLKHFGIKQP